MSDLERAQEWLGCRRGEFVDVLTGKAEAICEIHGLADDWPCGKATRLAGLLAEVRADELEDVAGAFASSANRVVKAKGETERTRYAYEVVEVLRNRAREIRDA